MIKILNYVAIISFIYAMLYLLLKYYYEYKMSFSMDIFFGISPVLILIVGWLKQKLRSDDYPSN